MVMKRVFVIDDEPQVQSLFSEALIRHGHTVSGALDGESAVKQLRSEKPDVIFLDLKLPGMNGVETLEQIRRVHKKVPVVVITAYPRDALIDAAIQLGMFACLVKPFSMMDVMAILEALELDQVA